jgi:hypothetical protein
LKGDIQTKEEEFKSKLDKLDKLLLQMPQFLHPNVPV